MNDKIVKSDDMAKITAALKELGTIAYRADRTPVDQTEESINAQIDVIASTLSMSESFPNPATRHTREQVLDMATNVRDCAWPADVKEYMVLIEPMLRAYAGCLAFPDEGLHSLSYYNRAFYAVLRELGNATSKFPTWPTDPLHAIGVVNEEVGELNKAVLQQMYEPHKNPPGAVCTEAIQAAAVLIRFILSLDRYRWTPCTQHIQGDLS